MKKKERDKLIAAIAISLYYHFVLFGLIWLLSYYDLIGNTALAALRPETLPLVLEFEQPAKPLPKPEPEVPEEEQPALPNRFFRIEDNPNANEKEPENTDIISTQSSVSAAPKKYEINNLASLPKTKQANSSKNPQEPLNDNEDENKAKDDLETGKEIQTGENLADLQGSVLYNNQIKFSKILLLKNPFLDNPDGSESPENPEPLALPKEFNGDLIGEPALSTYAWEYAPWLLDFKRKFYEKLYLPKAYTNLGLIHGVTTVRMKIARTGQLLDFELLDYDGHISLKESTVSAFKVSAPWKSLPDNFPDEYLVLTIRVIYPDLRKLFKK